MTSTGLSRPFLHSIVRLDLELALLAHNAAPFRRLVGSGFIPNNPVRRLNRLLDLHVGGRPIRSQACQVDLLEIGCGEDRPVGGDADQRAA